jgi:hypothetical protein
MGWVPVCVVFAKYFLVSWGSSCLCMRFLRIYIVCVWYFCGSTLFVHDILADRHWMLMILFLIYTVCAWYLCGSTLSLWYFLFYLRRLVGWNPMGWVPDLLIVRLLGDRHADPHVCLVKHSWLLSLLLSHSGCTVHFCFHSVRLLGDPLWMCMFICLVTSLCPNDGRTM